MSDMTELLTLTFQEVSKLTAQRDEAIKMLAEWCYAIQNKGTKWDDWKEQYKDASYRDCMNRELIDAAIESLE